MREEIVKNMKDDRKLKEVITIDRITMDQIVSQYVMYEQIKEYPIYAKRFKENWTLIIMTRDYIEFIRFNQT